MKITATNRQLWKDFFEAAIEFRDLAPWQWMSDVDMFGVQNPATGEIGWCCIMGNAGEVFALGVYPGLEGYKSYCRVLDTGYADLEEIDLMAAGLEQRILKVEFTDRDDVDKTDRDAFKALGLKFRGNNQWVQARDFLPGYAPIHLTDEQAVFMTHALRQAMDVALRFKNNLALEDKTGGMLVRIPAASGADLAWSDQYLPEPEWEEEPPREVNSSLINRTKKELKKEKAAICFSLHYMPGGIEKGADETRPFFPKMGIWIGYGSGMILGFELFSPKQFEKEFDIIFLQKFQDLELIPQQILVNSNMAYEAVEPIAKALDIELIFAPDVSEFQDVFGAMGQILGGGFL